MNANDSAPPGATADHPQPVGGEAASTAPVDSGTSAGRESSPAVGDSAREQPTTVVERWAKHAVPLWVLACPDAIPEALYNRLLAVVHAERTARSRGMRPTLEGAGFAGLVSAGEFIERVARLLADGKLSRDERPEARRVAAAAIATLERLLRAIDEADLAEVPAVRAVRT